MYNISENDNNGKSIASVNKEKMPCRMSKIFILFTLIINIIYFIITNRNIQSNYLIKLFTN